MIRVQVVNNFGVGTAVKGRVWFLEDCLWLRLRVLLTCLPSDCGCVCRDVWSAVPRWLRLRQGDSWWQDWRSLIVWLNFLKFIYWSIVISRFSTSLTCQCCTQLSLIFAYSTPRST